MPGAVGAPRRRDRAPRSTRSPSACARGGRLVYVGAGTSGRDRGARRVRVRGDVLHAARTGRRARRRRRARDRRSSRQPPRTIATPARATSQALGVGPADAVVGDQRQRARRRTSLGALEAAARGRRAHRVRRLASPDSRARRRSSSTRSPSSSGPEFLAGSTRLKAGTAQKLVLNTISTDLDDPAREDVRQPHGRRRRREREAPRRGCGGSSRLATRRAADGGRRGARRRRRRCASVAIVSLLARRRRRDARDRAWTRPAEHRATALEDDMRLGVEAALVDGALVPGDVEVVGGRVAGVRARVAERPRDRRARLRRSPGQRLRRRRLPRRPTPTGYRQGGRSAAGDWRHSVPADSHHIAGRTSSSPPSARCLPRRTGPVCSGRAFEGPFISALRLGIHPASGLRATPRCGVARAPARCGARPAG